MKTLKNFILTLIAAIVVVIGAEVAMLMAVGKDKLRDVPFVGDCFTVVEESDTYTEPEDPRLDEIDAILGKLKEREALIDTRDDQLDQLRQLRSDIEMHERRSRQLFDRVRALYPIIDEARAEALKALAKTYEKMAPEAAAGILEGKEDEECAELLVMMSDRSSAKVLEAFASMGDSGVEKEKNRKRATKITHLMRNTLMLTDEQAVLFSPPK